MERMKVTNGQTVTLRDRLGELPDITITVADNWCRLELDGYAQRFDLVPPEQEAEEPQATYAGKSYAGQDAPEPGPAEAATEVETDAETDAGTESGESAAGADTGTGSPDDGNDSSVNAGSEPSSDE